MDGNCTATNAETVTSGVCDIAALPDRLRPAQLGRRPGGYGRPAELRHECTAGGVQQ